MWLVIAKEFALECAAVKANFVTFVSTALALVFVGIRGSKALLSMIRG